MSWQLASLLIVLGALAACGWWYERSRPSSKLVALVATLAALAALGRDAFAAVPDVKPITAIVLIGGIALGSGPGFAIGALGALLSNLALGQGPWTPWQMLAWGLVGVAGGLLGHLTGRRVGRLGLALAAAVAAEGFNLVLDLYTWTTAGAHSLAAFGAVLGAAAVFDITHVVASFAFAFAFGPTLLAMLVRVRARLVVTWLAPGALPPGLLLALVVGAALAAGTAAGTAAGASPPATIARPLTYLLRAQNADGGFGAAPGQPSDELYTAWAAMGLAAVGRDPQDVRRDGHSVLDALRAGAAQVQSVGDVERTMLALRAAGAPAGGPLGRRSLLESLLGDRVYDGSFDGQINTTAFAVFALLAAGRTRTDPTVRAAAGWIARQQNADGGFSFAVRGQASDIDDTAAAIQALADAQGPAAPAIARALAFLAREQDADGGFPLQPGDPSDAQSTAWAVQALVAARRSPSSMHARRGRTPLQYLAGLTAADGSVRYSRASGQTPVWVTAQALTALAGAPFPIAAPPAAAPSTATLWRSK